MPPRFARLTAAASVGPDTRLLDLALAEGDSLGFIGGQYVIVDSGLASPHGKAARRAYSILSSDDEQTHFQLAVKRIGTGLGSSYLSDVAVGAQIAFSGPWGKLFPPENGDGAVNYALLDDLVAAGVPATRDSVESFFNMPQKSAA
jgi:ferredoxin-NADP reductase